MENKRAIVAIDVGKKGAYTVYDIDTKEYLSQVELTFDKSLCDIHKEFKLVINWLRQKEYGDIVFVIGEAFGQRVVVKKHSKFYGVIELLCEEAKIELIYVSDSTCRAKVLGTGNGRNKAMVHEKYQCATPDLSDCHLFTDWLLTRLDEAHNTTNHKGA